VKIPKKMPLDMSVASKEEIDMELNKGYRDMLEGRVRPAADVFADIRKDYDL